MNSKEKSGSIKGTSFHKKSSEKKGKNNKLDDFHVAASSVFQQYKDNAKERGLSFNLTKNELKVLIRQDCYYCGAPPSNVNARPGLHRAVMYNGIDCINNVEGYRVENCVPCCFTCNWAKSNMTVEQFRAWIKRVYLHQFMKKTTNMTPGQLIDSLFTTDYKCWWAQEKIGDISLSETERLEAATQAQSLNAKRNKLMRSIDELLNFHTDTVTMKTYQ